MPIPERILPAPDSPPFPGATHALSGGGDQLEQPSALGLVAAEVAEVVGHQQIEAIEACEFRGESQIAPPS